MAASVGSRGDSYDNALAETINGLYKAELIRRRGPWRSVAEVEAATAEWVAWWNHQRLHGSCDRLPPAEYEAAGTTATARRRERLLPSGSPVGDETGPGFVTAWAEMGSATSRNPGGASTTSGCPALIAA